jgi:hypothetical protein
MGLKVTPLLLRRATPEEESPRQMIAEPETGEGQEPFVPLRTSGPEPVKVVCDVWRIAEESNHVVFTELMSRSKRSTIGLVMLIAKGINPDPEVIVSCGPELGFVVNCASDTSAVAPELLVTSELAVYEVVAVPPPATPRAAHEDIPVPSVTSGKPTVPPDVGHLNVHVPAASTGCTVTVPEVVPRNFSCPVAVPVEPIESAGDTQVRLVEPPNEPEELY